MRTLFYPFLVPGGVLLLAVAVLVHWLEVPAGVEALLGYVPHVVLALGLFLGWRFNRSRLIFALLVLAIAERALALTDGALLLRTVAVLLPLNLTWISFLRERGLLTPWGLVRVAIIGAQVAAAGWLIHAVPDRLSAWLRWTPTHWLELTTVSVGPWAALALALSALIVLLHFLRRPAVFEAAFFWALPAIFLGLFVTHSQQAMTLYFSGAGLILLTGVLETSHFMAFRDELTGLAARRAMNEALLKLGSRYAIAMVDIDHFKKINDRYGHDVGDQVLRMVAAKLAAVAGGGRPFRYGGEEFAVIFPGKGAEEVVPYLERLRISIEQAEFVIRSRRRPRKKPENPKNRGSTRQVLKVAVSIGVAERGGKRAPEEVLKAADQALYRAKKQGRNQVCRK